jgi:hypothetical protein
VGPHRAQGRQRLPEVPPPLTTKYETLCLGTLTRCGRNSHIQSTFLAPTQSTVRRQNSPEGRRRPLRPSAPKRRQQAIDPPQPRGSRARGQRRSQTS